MLPKLHFQWERWKYNKTFEVYVSTLGNVKNKSKAMLAPKISQKGYVMVPVSGSDPKFMLLHRLVMLTWRPTPEAENLTVDHKNHNKRDNSLANLEWVTFEENQRRAVNDLTIQPQKKKKKEIAGVEIVTKDKTYTVTSINEVPELQRNFATYSHCSVKKMTEIIQDILTMKNSAGIRKFNGILFKLKYKGEERNEEHN